MAVATKKTARPKASTNPPKPKPNLVSTPGQWLSAWEAKNPGMVAPGVTAQQAQQTVPGFDPSKLGQPGQDPAWLVALLGRSGVGPGAPGGGVQPPAVPPAGGDAGGQPMSADLIRLLSGLQGDADNATNQNVAGHKELERLFLDPTNPYSQRNLLDKAFRETKMGSLTSMANAGQLWNGAYQEQQGIDQTNALTRENAMLEDYRKQSSGLDQNLDTYLRGLRSQGDTAQFGEANQSANVVPDVPDETQGSQQSVQAGGYPTGGSGPGQQAQQQTAAPAGAVSWSTWNGWSPSMRDRYRARHASEWERWRPR